MTSFAMRILLLAAYALALGGAMSSWAAVPATEKEAPDILQNWKFRNLGPAAAGGRVAAVVGIAGDANVYYVGAAAGGVWKTTDGGATWKAVFEKQPTASIGAEPTHGTSERSRDWPGANDWKSEEARQRFIAYYREQLRALMTELGIAIEVRPGEPRLTLAFTSPRGEIRYEGVAPTGFTLRD